MLFVSHNMGAIRNLCRSAIWLDNGQIVKKGTTEEVVRDYQKNQLKRFDESSYVAERSYEDVKNSSFYFRRVEILNMKGENTNIFRYNEKLILIVDLSSNPMSGNYNAEFYIYNELGQLVSVGSSGAYHGIYFRKDIKKIRIEIGPLVLTSGKYTISLSATYGIDGLPALRANTWEHACSFTIIESEPFRPGRDISSANEGVCILQQSFSEAE